MIHLFEGLDRAGKSTAVAKLLARPRTRLTVPVFFKAPPRMPDGSRLDAHVRREMATVYQLAAENPGVDFVLDRGHISSFAYQQIRDAGSVRKGDVYRWERELDRRLGDLDRKVVVVDAPAIDLAARDDGESTWTRETLSDTMVEIRREQRVFAEILLESTWPQETLSTARGERPREVTA